MKNEPFKIATAAVVIACMVFAPVASQATLVRFIQIVKDDLNDTRFHLAEIEAFADGTEPNESGDIFDEHALSDNDVGDGELLAYNVGAIFPEVGTTETLEHGSGNTDPNNTLETAGAVWSTANNLEEEAQYTLDLGAEFDITTIRMWPRADGCCAQRWESLIINLYADNGGEPGAKTGTLEYEGTGANNSVEFELGSAVDEDEDGMPDGWETNNGLNPEVDDSGGDLDGDGLLNLAEFESGTNPQDPDSDKDGLGDGVETKTGTWVSAENTGTDPALEDSDGDGISDGVESNSGTFVDEEDTGTNPNLTDSDADTMPDDYEVANGLNPTVSDGDGDIDEDGATNLKEFELGTNQRSKDTDGDTLLDGVETKTGIWVSADDRGTNPLTDDSDGDGLTDTVETNSGTFVNADNPGTNPNLADTDDDGFSDGIEISQKSNPLNAASKPSVAFVTVGRPDLVDEDGEVIDDGGPDGWSGISVIETPIPESDDGQTQGTVSSWNYITDSGRVGSVENLEYHVTPLLIESDGDEYRIAAVGEAHTPSEGGAQLGIPFTPIDGSAEFDVSGDLTYHIAVLQQREEVDNGNGGVIPFAGAGGPGMFQMDTPGPDHEPAVGDPIDRGHESAEGGRNYSFNFDIVYGAKVDDGLRFTDIEVGAENVVVTWKSEPDSSYAIDSSPDFVEWAELTDGYVSQGESTSYTDPRNPENREVYYRVRQEE